MSCHLWIHRHVLLQTHRKCGCSAQYVGITFVDIVVHNLRPTIIACRWRWVQGFDTSRAHVAVLLWQLALLCLKAGVRLFQLHRTSHGQLAHAWCEDMIKRTCFGDALWKTVVMFTYHCIFKGHVFLEDETQLCINQAWAVVISCEHIRFCHLRIKTFTLMESTRALAHISHILVQECNNVWSLKKLRHGHFGWVFLSATLHFCEVFVESMCWICMTNTWLQWRHNEDSTWRQSSLHE